MKHINKILLFIVTTFFLAPSIANAASATFAVSGPSQGVVGNQLTLTVTVSSSTSLGGWELALQYDKSYLQLSSAPEGANGTHVAGNATSSGTKSKSYTYKFKVLKSGTTTISPTSTDAYGWDETPLSPSNVSKKVTLKTQAEIEASYSSNAYLKSITVGEYALTPEFNKETKEYEVEVENDVETVTISALKEDANASISGTGDKTLIEGTNKFEIVCTAQKGNSITYVVNVTRKELNPIKVTINGKEYGILRKKDSLPELAGFAESTTIYQDSEVPALVNDVLNIKVIGLKDDENNIYTYVYDEATSTIKNLYVELITGENIITPSDFNKTLNGYNIKEVDIKG
ncbi:MAG: cadherin-like beta sandwich domain-containing protein, partial [Bacilli bacterium]|nr:cadherin-like beta sandwich domain-containing protein [Bacilli bacterium]